MAKKVTKKVTKKRVKKNVEHGQAPVSYTHLDVYKRQVDVPASKMKLAIADILLNEGYIKKYDIIEEGNFKTIRITLKYGKDKNDKVITGIKKISKPGLRVYAGKDELPRVLGGLGVAIISTNKGVITDKEARKANVGGEVLALDVYKRQVLG